MAMIGTRVMRTEDPDLVTGRGTFVDNLVLPDAAHVVYVRSTIAHARIVKHEFLSPHDQLNYVRIAAEADLDATLRGWVRAVHEYYGKARFVRS